MLNYFKKNKSYLVASIDLRPASESLLMNSILVAVGTTCFSFCSPSLGPTSTILTNDLVLAVYIVS